jgi:hypothetical protein
MDLKPFYDAARAASDKMQGILDQMNTAFNAGTEEGKQAALDLRPGLDQAKSEAEVANQLYVSMRDAAGTSDSAARLFVPVAVASGQADGANAKEMSRAAFMDLDADARMKFMRGGGQIVEPAE